MKKIKINQLVIKQVRYLGLLENVKVRRAGYAARVTFNKFMSKKDFILLSLSLCINEDEGDRIIKILSGAIGNLQEKFGYV